MDKLPYVIRYCRDMAFDHTTMEEDEALERVAAIFEELDINTTRDLVEALRGE